MSGVQAPQHRFRSPLEEADQVQVADNEHHRVAMIELWQRLDTVGDNGGWKYSCSVPNRQNPTIRRTYEATAGDPVAAVRAVLDQLSQEQ